MTNQPQEKLEEKRMLTEEINGKDGRHTIENFNKTEGLFFEKL